MAQRGNCTRPRVLNPEGRWSCAVSAARAFPVGAVRMALLRCAWHCYKLAWAGREAAAAPGREESRVTKHIGIAAVSAEGAALCYRTICAEGPAMLGRHAHPEVSVHTYPLSDYMVHIDAGRWDDVGAMLLSSAEKLRAAGADFAICPDNTAHQGLDLVRARSPIPWLHIGEEVAAAAARERFRRVLVLGTRYLMEGPVYPRALSAAGIAHEIPDAPTRERINTLTFDE